MKPFVLIIIVIFIVSCGNKTIQSVENNQIQSAELQRGDSIATIAQNELLLNVTSAIQKYGIAGAVDFCNERALPITDSVSLATTSHIQRLSNKNRNPLNAVQTKMDSIAWGRLQNAEEKQVIVQEGSDSYYYKSITIGMPTCLACHGSKDKDISPATLKAIVRKYPNDKATGYRLKELRGMWKIKV